MDFANRGNRPAQQPAPNVQKETARPERPETPQMNNKNDGKLNMSKISSLFVLFGGAILVAALLVALIFGGNSTQSKESDLINTERYQAVFLNSQDGQVYFGKLAVYNNNTYVLNDIYYVRVENPIQPQGEQAQQPNISLAKLGNELHGPDDVMFISRDKVLYWENLKNEGQVVTAITEFKANGEQAPATQQTQPANTPQQDDTPAAPADDETPTAVPATP